jgi:hypothetical protein
MRASASFQALRTSLKLQRHTVDNPIREQFYTADSAGGSLHEV